MSPYDPTIHHRQSIRLSGYDYGQAGAYFITICTHNRQCLFGEIVDGTVRLSPYGQIVLEEWQRTGVLRPYVKLDLFVIMPNHFHAIVFITANAAGWRGHAQDAPTDVAGIGHAQDAPTDVVGIGHAQGAPTDVVGIGHAQGAPMDVVGIGHAQDAPTNVVGIGHAQDAPTNVAGIGHAQDAPTNVAGIGHADSRTRTAAFGRPVPGAIPAIVRGFKSAVSSRIKKCGTQSLIDVWQRNYYEHVVRDEDDLTRLREYVTNNVLSWELDQLHPDSPSKW